MSAGRPIKHTQYSVIPRGFAGCVYAAELDNGVVKVGFSRNPRSRMMSLNNQVKRWFGARLVRWHISADIDARSAIRIETLVLKGLAEIKPPLAGKKEFFSGISFDTAAACIDCAMPAKLNANHWVKLAAGTPTTEGA